jgi:hypothetical protein
MAACQAADTATALYAVRIGAVEANGLMVWAVAHPAVFIAIKGAFVWFAWTRWDQIGPDGRLLVNAVSCLPVPLNLRVIGRQRHLKN